MAAHNFRALDPGYTSEVNSLDEKSWYEAMEKFDDANIYQTWAYAAVIAGRRNMSHVVLKRNGDVVAIALARIAKVPLLKLGIAYVHWGPLWRRGAADKDTETFRQAIRALRNEFVCKRGLVLRLFPVLFDDRSGDIATMLNEEGFSSVAGQGHGRTILMDLNLPLEDLRDGMRPHWQRELKVAEKKELRVEEGAGDQLFESFIHMYEEMVSRKRFVEPNDIHAFRRIQAALPEKHKMKVMLCRTAEEVSAGAICSAGGKSAIYLFGATSNAGMKSRGSYLLQWRFIGHLKEQGITAYNLNGVNPVTNPGTYKFKNDLAGKNGREVSYLGRFDCHDSLLSSLCVRGGDIVRSSHRSLKTFLKTARSGKLRTNPAQ